MLWAHGLCPIIGAMCSVYSIPRNYSKSKTEYYYKSSLPTQQLTHRPDALQSASSSSATRSRSDEWEDLSCSSWPLTPLPVGHSFVEQVSYKEQVSSEPLIPPPVAMAA